MSIVVTLFRAYEVTKFTIKKIGIFRHFFVIHYYPKVDKEKNAGKKTYFFFQSQNKKGKIPFHSRMVTTHFFRKIQKLF
jgi:hypothetical protein